LTDLFEKIQEAKDKLGDNAAFIINKELNLEQWDEANLKGCCPFHHESTPSFSWNTKEHYFHCFGCGKNFGILDLYTTLEGTYKKALKRLFEELDMGYDVKDYGQSVKDRKDYFKGYIYPREETNTDRSQVEDYLAKRGISKATLDYMDVKQDVHGNIVYELRDLDNTLLAVKYRPSHAIKHGEMKMWWQPKVSMCPILYNSNKVDITKPLVITEGYQDTLACVEAGYSNVCSINGGANDLGWIEFNYDFLENFKEIILWFDNDSAGQEGLKNTINRLGEYRCKVIKPTVEQEDKVEAYYQTFSENVFIRKTDANNILLSCGKGDILQLINNAEEVPLENIVDLTTVEEFDIEKTHYLSTGLRDLDSKIYGYIDGTMNIWTAYSGVGKTTLIAQSCVLDAVDKGESVFWFNAESTTSQMLNWILSQAAGRDHVIEFTNPNGFKYYKPTTQAVEKIKETYKNRMFVYDNLLLTSPLDVFSRMKDMYKKRGTRVFVLDNWLCLNFKGIADADLTAVQVEFMNELIHFAKRNSCTIHLVAHPRKPQVGTPLNEYDILGTSNIVNMADRIYGLEQTYDKKLLQENFDRQFTVFKDRTLGEKGYRMGLRYDKATRRLYGSSDDIYKKYNWDNGSIKYSSTKFGSNGILVGRRKLECDNLNESECGEY